MNTASVQSSSISINADLERYQERRKAERELYGAIDLLNTLMSGINLIQKFRMVDENQAVLVDIKFPCATEVPVRSRISYFTATPLSGISILKDSVAGLGNKVMPDCDKDVDTEVAFVTTIITASSV